MKRIVFRKTIFGAAGYTTRSSESLNRMMKLRESVLRLDRLCSRAVDNQRPGHDLQRNHNRGNQLPRPLGAGLSKIADSRLQSYVPYSNRAVVGAVGLCQIVDDLWIVNPPAALQPHLASENCYVRIV